MAKLYRKNKEKPFESFSTDLINVDVGPQGARCAWSLYLSSD